MRLLLTHHFFLTFFKNKNFCILKYICIFTLVKYIVNNINKITMNKEILDAEVLEINPAIQKKETVKEVVRLIDNNGEVNLDALTESDKEKYEKINKSLVVTDINSISNYGVELQSTMTKYSNDFLNTVRTQQSGEMGGLITDLLTELSYINTDELEKPSTLKRIARKIPLVNKLVSSVDKILMKYDTIEKNVDAISKKIAVTRLSALRDNGALGVMFNNNIEYGKKIDELIIAGKLKLKEVNDKLQDMTYNYQNYESYEIQDVQEFSHNLERRLNDMLTLRYVIKQSLPQIRIVQYNNIAVADKANSIIATTIPVWKNQLSIAVALNNQNDSILAQRKVTETTNAILRKNAELLKQNSIAVAEENERGAVDVEVLKETTQQLIETIKEVKRIHDEGSAKRKEAEAEILKIESELEKSMTSMNNKELSYSA